ncbi:MAG: MarR family transcriptional regulator [Pseudomonadota bacterium]
MTWPEFQPNTDNAFLAHFARRLSDLVIAQGTEMLRESGLLTPISAVSTVLYLKRVQAATVTDLSEAFGYTHQMAVQRIAGLEREGLVEKTFNNNDRRSRLVQLTAAGRKEALELADVVVRASAAFDALFDEMNCNVTAAIRGAEDRLREKPLIDRMSELTQTSERKS